jgi:pilus assembly protein Flp/PilA
MDVVAMQMIARAMDSLRTLGNREEGQGMVEYALILALVAVVAAVALGPLGEQIATLFTEITGEL